METLIYESLDTDVARKKCLEYVDEDQKGLFNEFMEGHRIAIRFLGVFGHFDETDDPAETRQVISVEILNRVTMKKHAFRFGMSFMDTAILLGCDRTADGGFYLDTHHMKQPSKGLDNRKEKATVRNGILYDVLASVRTEYYCPESFEDFCAEYGYENDSRQAERTFKQCQKHSQALRSVIDERYLDALPQ